MKATNKASQRVMIKFKQLSSLEIKAFDRTFSISDKVISDLDGVYVNGLAVSYEAGYKVTGGRSLYITFVKSSLQKETARVALILKENGEYRVKKSVIKNLEAKSN